ncbi:MAG: putative Ig domain-containing protein, partial [Verrucomicrobia bacterium]|nr:putative Ig domain-containing protein [Verrucomicrobiota bacterium]
GTIDIPVTGLTGGETYYYRIHAQNVAGEVWSPQATKFNAGSFEFTTNSLPGQELILWLDASDVDGDGNASNEPFGGSLNFWRDKSGQGHHAGNGNGPEIAPGRWNGKTIAKFNGIDQYLRVANSEPFNFGEKATLFLVTKGDTIANWRPIISKRGEDGVGWQFRKPNNDYATFTIRGTTGPDGPYGGTKINDETHVWAARRDGFKRTQWADGNQEYSNDDRGPVPATDDDVVIGARDQDGIGSYAGVEIGEILFFRSDLSDDEVAMVEGYLSHKWGLSEQLSGTHPHKENPPSFENRPGILNKSEISLLKGNPFSLQIIADRSTDSYLASGLPSGLSINPLSGLISGTPTTEGTYGVTIHASNAAGSRPSTLTLHVKDYTRWEYSAPITFPGYDGNETLTDFPVYIEIDAEINSFSYEQFNSPAGFDLRFVGPDGAQELKYEPVKWDPTGVSAYWVRVPELKAGTTITAKWGNPSAAT